jgi:hypothetical protein
MEREPACEEIIKGGADIRTNPCHDWRHVSSWGHGPGVVVREHCPPCGLVRVTDTGAVDWPTGETITTVRYETEDGEALQ